MTVDDSYQTVAKLRHLTAFLVVRARAPVGFAAVEGLPGLVDGNDVAAAVQDRDSSRQRVERRLDQSERLCSPLLAQLSIGDIPEQKQRASFGGAHLDLNPSA